MTFPAHIYANAPAGVDRDSSVPGDISLIKKVDMGNSTFGALQVSYSGIDTNDVTVTLYCSIDGIGWDVKSNSAGQPVHLTLDGGPGPRTKIASLNGVIGEQFYKLVTAKGTATTGAFSAWMHGKR